MPIETGLPGQQAQFLSEQIGGALQRLYGTAKERSKYSERGMRCAEQALRQMSCVTQLAAAVSRLRIKPAGAGYAPADGCDYFSSATCTLSEPSTVRILARSAWLLLATSTEP